MRAAQFLVVFTPILDVKCQWAVLENTGTNIHTDRHTHTVLVGLLPDVQFSQLSDHCSQWEMQFQKCWSLLRRVSYSNYLPGSWARAASQLAAKF